MQDKPFPSRASATWAEESVGAKEFTLPRSSTWYCTAPPGAGWGYASAYPGPPPPPPSPTCTLHIAVSGFEAGEFRLLVRNYTEVRPPPPPQQLLQAGHGPTPHPSCRSSLASLPGSRPPPRSAQGEPLCAVGCPALWLGDGYCDEACYKAACRWDAQDCSAEPGCADGCLPTYLGDGECDAECNTAACAFDAGAGAASDCDAGAGECYTDRNGTDYRGAVSTTKSGRTCQAWAAQSPQQHTMTHRNFPDDGLGGHNHCRNPGRMQPAPWCYTTDPALRYEACDVGAPRAACAGAPAAGAGGSLYQSLCPVDCRELLGNGRCEVRCNISSCHHDRGDCGLADATPGTPVVFAPGQPCPDSCHRRDKLGDKFCDRECYTEACGWDKGDCDGGSAGKRPLDRCADGCRPTDLHDERCDAACNVAACGFDGAADVPLIGDVVEERLRRGDCDHGYGECFERPDGADYKGGVDRTEDGTPCMVWDAHGDKQSFDSSLGGHSRCRNPRTPRGGRPRQRPWCWKRGAPGEPDAGWGYCAVGNASAYTCNDFGEQASTFEAAIVKAWRASVALIAALSSSGALLLLLAVAVAACCLWRRQRRRYIELEAEFARARARHLADTISTTKMDDGL